MGSPFRFPSNNRSSCVALLIILHHFARTVYQNLIITLSRSRNYRISTSLLTFSRIKLLSTIKLAVFPASNVNDWFNTCYWMIFKWLLFKNKKVMLHFTMNKQHLFWNNKCEFQSDSVISNLKDGGTYNVFTYNYYYLLLILNQVLFSWGEEHSIDGQRRGFNFLVPNYPQK